MISKGPKKTSNKLRIFLFQTFAVFWMLYSFFWVITGVCRRFGTLFIGGVNRKNYRDEIVGVFIWERFSCLHRLWRWSRQSVPKRRHIKFRCRGITQKKEYNKLRNVRRASHFWRICVNTGTLITLTTRANMASSKYNVTTRIMAAMVKS